MATGNGKYTFTSPYRLYSCLASALWEGRSGISSSRDLQSMALHGIATHFNCIFYQIFLCYLWVQLTYLDSLYGNVLNGTGRACANSDLQIYSVKELSFLCNQSISRETSFLNHLPTRFMQWSLLSLLIVIFQLLVSSRAWITYFYCLYHDVV